MSGTLDPVTLTGAVVHHILVVDEDRAAAQNLKAFLEQCGYLVTVAKDGGQAHSTMMKKPDFVILEAILHGETGYEICERIKKQESGMPILFLTVIDIEESRDLAMRVGCDGYLLKPYDPELLLKSIKAISEMVWQRTHNIESVKESYIRFQCRCGKKLRVSEVHRGKPMTCPECAELLTVPRHG